MSYLPGVPNMGPAPVGPTGPTIKTSASIGVGKPHGIAAMAAGVGKPSTTEHLGSVVGRTGKGISTITGGNPMAHGLNDYGKGAKSTALLGGSQLSAGVDPTQHPGVKQVRGGSGGIRTNPRQGGLGPGRMSTPGNDSNYSMNNADME